MSVCACVLEKVFMKCIFELESKFDLDIFGINRLAVNFLKDFISLSLTTLKS